jgi:DNA-binding response OmpR family regulator
VLLVDDEPMVLDALAANLARRFAILTAGDAAGALAIAADRPLAVIVSDLRMPAVDGLELLRRMREHHPDTVRIMLSGHADLEAAVRAVNQGAVFRFLIKPCPVQEVAEALDAGIAQHRLITAERELLQQTFAGSIRVLTELLAHSHPAAFGRAVRVRALVAGLCRRLGRPSWDIEVAAMLAQIGCVTLPPTTAARYAQGERLAPSEQIAVDRLPLVADRLLASIPRLERVREVLRGLAAGGGAEGGARILRAATDFDLLRSRGLDARAAVAALRMAAAHDPLLIAALEAEAGAPDAGGDLLHPDELAPGMYLSDEVGRDGVLLAASGAELTPTLIGHLRRSLPRSARVAVSRARP